MCACGESDVRTGRAPAASPGGQTGLGRAPWQQGWFQRLGLSVGVLKLSRLVRLHMMLHCEAGALVLKNDGISTPGLGSTRLHAHPIARPLRCHSGRPPQQGQRAGPPQLKCLELAL